MVSAQIIAEIRGSFEALGQQRLDIHQYSPPLFDVVFEIISADTFIAGIASKLLDRDAVGPEERAVVDHPLLVERRWWRLENGELFDIEPYVEIYKVAVAVEDLRMKCRAAVGT
jgi:hypothetical protein